MQGTPGKVLPSKNSSLRAQIESKLLTDKKIDNNKENLKKYHSHAKSTNQNKFYSCSNWQNSHHQLPKESQQDNNHVTSQINEKTILQYESLDNPNFFGYPQWLQLNQKFFTSVDEKYIKTLWKIMRTINYGDVFIPSGLVFQVVQSLFFPKNQQKVSLKNVFNNFLQMNNVSDRVNNFRELKNYLSLQEVQVAYKYKESTQKKESCSKKRFCASLESSVMSEKNVFDRNYEDYKSRNLSKNKQHFKRLLEMQTDPECIFRPKISQYCPKKLLIDQSSRPQRECYSNSKWTSLKLTNNDLIQNSNFKATPFQRSRMQNQSLQSVPGATQHINRCKYSEAKKRKIQRYYQNPTHVFKNY